MSKEISQLHPKLQPLCLQFLHNCVYNGLDVRVTFTYRTPEEQDALYSQGRTKAGLIVTNLKGDKSLHCFELDGKPAARAFDFGVFYKDKYIADGDDPRYLQAAEIGEKLGLESGIRWKHPHDPSHLQLKA